MSETPSERIAWLEAARDSDLLIDQASLRGIDKARGLAVRAELSAEQHRELAATREGSA